MRKIMRLNRVRVGFLVVALFGLVSIGGASGATTTTVGQTDAAANYVCGSGGEYDLTTAVTSGSAYVVPPGDWTVNSWSTFAGSMGGSMSMVVFRPTVDIGAYTVVATSPVQTLTPSSLNTFPTSVRVKGGDQVGFWATNAACSTETALPTDVSPFDVGPLPLVGDMVTPFPVPGFKANISASLTKVSPAQLKLEELLASLSGQGPGNSFITKVKEILSNVSGADKAKACSNLAAFNAELKAQVGKKVTLGQAIVLTALSNAVRSALGC